VQYDSLSDLVAFGVAPAVLMFSWILSDLGKVGWLVAFLYMACAALRLARFNTAPDAKVFYGLASPAAAGTMATTVWTWSDNMGQAVGLELAVPLAIVTSLIALLMVSNVRYYSPKHIDLNGRVPFFYMFVIVVLFGVVTVYPPGMLLLIGIVYTVSGPLTLLIRRKYPQPSPS